MHPFRWRRRWVVVVGAVSLVAGCVARHPGRPPTRRQPTSPPTTVTPTASPPDDGIVDIAVGEPSRPRWTATAGDDLPARRRDPREQAVLPRDGDTFRENPAPSCPARDLTDAGWNERDGAWSVDGQTEEGLVHGTLVEGGNPQDRRPEELFLDGDRAAHVSSRDELGPGRWYFDYDADRVWLGRSRGVRPHEISTTLGAFGGSNVRGVTMRT